MVLIDCSVRTESIEWEVETALRETDPVRVLVITADQTADVTISGATILSYSTDRKGIKRLRAQVNSWAEKVLEINLRKSSRIGACVWGFLLLLLFGFVLISTIMSAGTQ
jgi:hypothetical protein